MLPEWLEEESETEEQKDKKEKKRKFPETSGIEEVRSLEERLKRWFDWIDR